MVTEKRYVIYNTLKNISVINPNLPKRGPQRTPPLYKNVITRKVWMKKPKIL